MLVIERNQSPDGISLCPFSVIREGDMVNTSIKDFIPKIISVEQAKDTGMAMVFICLLVTYFGNKLQYSGFAILLLLINMAWPSFYKPIAKIWFALSVILGTVMSKIILSILFFGLVMPVGIIRKSMGKDSMQLKKWRNGKSSVFIVRDHEITYEDIQHPY